MMLFVVADHFHGAAPGKSKGDFAPRLKGYNHDPCRPVVSGRHSSNEQLKDICPIDSIPQPMLFDC